MDGQSNPLPFSGRFATFILLCNAHQLVSVNHLPKRIMGEYAFPGRSAQPLVSSAFDDPIFEGGMSLPPPDFCVYDSFGMPVINPTVPPDTTPRTNKNVPVSDAVDAQGRAVKQFDYERGGDKHQLQGCFFQGETNNMALVIGGIHASERSGVEVAEELIKNLSAKGAAKPHYSVLVIPQLFPGNYAAGEAKYQNSKNAEKLLGGDNAFRKSRVCQSGTDTLRKSDGKAIAANVSGKKDLGKKLPPKCKLDKAGNIKNGVSYTDPNRQAPAMGKGVDAKDPRDARGRVIEPENYMLISLVNRYNPKRVAMLHAVKSGKGAKGMKRKKNPKLNKSNNSAGTFADPRTAAPPAKGVDPKYDKLDKAARKKGGQMGGKALGFDSDGKLALAMANHAEDKFDSHSDIVDLRKKKKLPANKQIDVVEGHSKDKKNITHSIYKTDSDPEKKGDYQPRTDNSGTSFGTWLSTEVDDKAYPNQNRAAIQTITLEVGDQFRSDEKNLTANQAKVRKAEIEAMASSLEEIFLGPGNKP